MSITKLAIIRREQLGAEVRLEYAVGSGPADRVPDVAEEGERREGGLEL